jgi:uncharacterized membrane protein (UPF0136 family)
MFRDISKVLIVYGGWLLLIGVLGFLSNPEKAKTALMSGGTFGSLTIVWAILIRQGKLWALNAAIATTTLMVVAFTWRAWASWSAVMGGNSEKMVAAILITGLWLASVIVLPLLFRSSRSLSSLTGGS